MPAITTNIRDLLEAQSPAESISWINELDYGDPGAGKTYKLGTGPDEFYPMLLIDVEGGTMTLRNTTKKIDVIQARSMKHIKEVHDTLKLENDGYYKSVGLDSLTEMQKLDMQTVMKEFYDKDPDKTDIDVPNQRAWGKSGERVRRRVREFRDLPMHFFATAHAAEREDERTSKMILYPSLPGKLRGELAGFFDIVGYLRAVEERKEDNTVEIVRVLQVVKTDRVIAKDRTGALGDVLRNPTIEMMWEMINATNKQNGKGKGN